MIQPIRNLAVVGGAVLTVLANAIAALPSAGAAPPTVCVGEASNCLVIAGSAERLAEGSWTSIPAGPLSARSGQVTLWTGRQLLIWGGLPASSQAPALSDGATYQPASNTWSLLPPGPLEARTGSTAVWTGREALIWGGARLIGHSGLFYFSGGAGYDPVTRRWRHIPAAPIAGRTDAAGIWTGRDFVVLGGDGPDALTGYTDGAAYNPITNSWRRLPPLPLSARRSGSETGLGGATELHAVWTGRSVLMWVVRSTVTPLFDAAEIAQHVEGFRLDSNGHHWTELATPTELPPMWGTQLVWAGRKVLFVGGTECAPGMSCPAPFPSAGSIRAFVPRSNRWTSVPGSVVVNGGRGQIIWTGQALVAINGGVAVSSSTGPVLSPGDATALDPQDETWTALPRCPVGETYTPSIAWTGHQLLFWAGDAINGPIAVALTQSRSTTRPG